MKATDSTYKELREKMLLNDPQERYVHGVVYTKWGWVEYQIIKTLIANQWLFVSFETNIHELDRGHLEWELNYK